MACVVGGFECEALCCADVVVENVANGFSFSEDHAVVAFQVGAELFVHFDAIEDGRRDICQCFHGYAWVEWDFYDERVWDAGVESFLECSLDEVQAPLSYFSWSNVMAYVCIHAGRYELVECRGSGETSSMCFR